MTITHTEEILRQGIDRTVKALFVRSTGAFLQLLRIETDPRDVIRSDTAINLPEYRADQVCIIRRKHGRRSWALLLEYQLIPDKAELEKWLYKKHALSLQLGMPVILCVIYLERGRRRTFPDTLIDQADGLTNSSQFYTIRLWEHAERIRSGELRDLAPLLPLAERKPSRETLLRSRQLILQSPVSAQPDLLSMAITVGARFFPIEELREIFKEEIEMLRGASLFEEWVQEGEERGLTTEARSIALDLLRERFGELPDEIKSRVQSSDEPTCRSVAKQLLRVTSLADLDWSAPTPAAR